MDIYNLPGVSEYKVQRFLDHINDDEEWDPNDVEKKNYVKIFIQDYLDNLSLDSLICIYFSTKLVIAFESDDLVILDASLGKGLDVEHAVKFMSKYKDSTDLTLSVALQNIKTMGQLFEFITGEAELKILPYEINDITTILKKFVARHPYSNVEEFPHSNFHLATLVSEKILDEENNPSEMIDYVRYNVPLSVLREYVSCGCSDDERVLLRDQLEDIIARDWVYRFPRLCGDFDLKVNEEIEDWLMYFPSLVRAFVI